MLKPIKDTFISVTEAAVVLGCSERTVYRMFRSGVLHPRKIANSTMILKQDLKDLINTGRGKQ